MSDCWPDRRDYDVAARDCIAMLGSRGIEARMVGSYAAGRLQVPYSDIDVLAVAETGKGCLARDSVVDAARSMPGTLCVAVDPFADESLIYSVIANGLHIDWFVVERDTTGEERPVWRGDRQWKTDVRARCWSALLSVLSLSLRDRGKPGRLEAVRELSQHWSWLAAQGIDVSALQPTIPAEDSNLADLIARTAAVIPREDSLAALLESRLRQLR
jgi:hypothetical protein